MKDLEIWKIYNIPFNSNGLIVSNLGNIKNNFWQDRPIQDNGFGYKKCAIHNKGTVGFSRIKNLYIHRIVAELFLEKPLPHKTQVNHIDGDKRNNKEGNLEWVCPKENIKHSHDTGLSRNRREHGTTVKAPDSVVLNAYLAVKIGMYGVRESAERHGLPRTTLSSIMNKRSRRDVTDLVDEFFMFN